MHRAGQRGTACPYRSDAEGQRVERGLTRAHRKRHPEQRRAGDQCDRDNNASAAEGPVGLPVIARHRLEKRGTDQPHEP